LTYVVVYRALTTQILKLLDLTWTNFSRVMDTSRKEYPALTNRKEIPVKFQSRSNGLTALTLAKIRSAKLDAAVKSGRTERNSESPSPSVALRSMSQDDSAAEVVKFSADPPSITTPSSRY
jgi:hypothetical protein